jgi:hypothetical protein
LSERPEGEPSTLEGWPHAHVGRTHGLRIGSKPHERRPRALERVLQKPEGRNAEHEGQISGLERTIWGFEGPSCGLEGRAAGPEGATRAPEGVSKRLEAVSSRLDSGTRGPGHDLIEFRRSIMRHGSSHPLYSSADCRVGEARSTHAIFGSLVASASRIGWTGMDPAPGCVLRSVTIAG